MMINYRYKDKNQAEKEQDRVNKISLGTCPLLGDRCTYKCVFYNNGAVEKIIESRGQEKGEPVYYVLKPDCLLKKGMKQLIDKNPG